MKLYLAAAFALMAAPVFAADPTTMTCKDMMAMDSKGMTDSGIALKSSMKDNAKMMAMSDADVTKMAGEACTANPDGTVMDAMHISMLSTMTCKDMMAMDDAAKTSAGETMKMAMKKDAKMGAMAGGELTAKAAEACTAHPDATVMDAMKM